MRLIARIKEWVMYDAFSYVASCVVHMAVFLVLALTLGNIDPKPPVGEAPSFETVSEEPLEESQLTRFEVGETPIDPGELTTESLTMTEAPQIAQSEQINDNSATFQEAGGGLAMATATTGLGGAGGFEIKGTGLGPVVRGAGGIGGGKGTGKNPGSGGGEGVGFGGRGSGMRKALTGSYGGTKNTERAVAAALSWIARHQNADGSWSIDHRGRCKDRSCTGPGEAKANAAATALALLPFFAAGQTHESKGPYQKTIFSGLTWLARNQKPNGDLSAGGSQMYSHGLATIALCEAYGMSRDKRLSGAAQLALKFIESGQDQNTGGWWYTYRQPGGDTSVYGWQLMGLKSGLMAGLRVNPKSLDMAKHWLTTVSKPSTKGQFSYRPDVPPSPSMTAVGLLASQYLGTRRSDPAIGGGVKYLMGNMPNIKARNCYYWYYATQVMHNIPGPEWDSWNRQMRRTLIESQHKKDECAAGSWDPMQPSKEPHGQQGGRLMVTSLSALTLEVYYRYLPLYQEMDEGDDAGDLEPAKAGDAKKAGDTKKAGAKETKPPAEKPDSREKPRSPSKGKKAA